MSAEQFSCTTGAVIGLCEAAFPDGDYADQKIRFQGRRFQDQLLVHLSAIVQRDSNALWRVLLRVGCFLRDDGRYLQAIKLLEIAVDMIGKMKGEEHANTLESM